MRLPYAAGPDEGDVAVRVEVGQRRELAQRGRVPALDPGEVEALEGLGLAPGQPAQPQQRLDGGEPPLLRKVGEGGAATAAISPSPRSRSEARVASSSAPTAIPSLDAASLASS